MIIIWKLHSKELNVQNNKIKNDSNSGGKNSIIVNTRESNENTQNKIIKNDKYTNSNFYTKNENFWNYLVFKLSCKKKNNSFKKFEEFRKKIISEEHLIRNHLNIYNLIKITEKNEI